MTIAEKLTQIAENSRSLYDAGYADGHIEGIDVRTVRFDGWHKGINEADLIGIEHGLGVRPRFVSICADDIESIKSATLPEGIAGTVVQSDRMYGRENSESYPSTYVRCVSGEFSAAIMGTTPDRLIAKCDERYVYVNSAASSYAWAPSEVTSFTMICLA